MISKVVFLLALYSITNFSHASALTQTQIEVLQTQAVIEFHSKKFAASKATLRKILSDDPINSNALELLALNHRALKEDTEAEKVYEGLLKKGNASRIPAYHFELAMMKYKEKKTRDAILHFEAAASGHFNPGTSNFFLGIINFNRKFWEEARYNFTASLTYDDGKPMAQVSRYYLASTYAQMGKTDAAIVNYHQAQKDPENEGETFSTPGAKEGFTALNSDIRKNALKELKALDKNQRFISVSMLSQWDSNVQANPSEVNNPVAASSQKSLKAVIAATAGYSTSPIKKLQLTPSYRFYTNYNAHYLATDYNFITHSGDFYALYKPYERLSYGLKADITYSMKNNLLTTDSRRALHYRSYSLVADLGPVFKYELTPQILMGGQVSWHPQKFFTDPASGDNIRTGDGLYSLLSAEFVSAYWWFNPTVTLSFEWDDPRGKNYRAYIYGFGLSNPLKLSERLTLTPEIDITSSDYYETKLFSYRQDNNVTVKASASYTINKRWTGAADISYIDNESTLSTTYKYHRVVVTGGATYSF